MGWAYIRMFMVVGRLRNALPLPIFPFKPQAWNLSSRIDSLLYLCSTPIPLTSAVLASFRSRLAAAKWMVRLPKAPSQAWRSVLKNHNKLPASIDLSTVPTRRFRILRLLGMDFGPTTPFRNIYFGIESMAGMFHLN